ncbi:MAG: DNA cytosine methyltransferase [Betaproteobacteria bacterium]|nr:DNA cytosine methyltransferase [Betaproteobacteria bacterium]
MAPFLAAERLRPSFVLVENVPGVRHAESTVVTRAKKKLASLGYKSVDFSVSAASAGLPQTRTRHALLAWSSSFFSGTFSVEPSTVGPALFPFIRDLEDECLEATSASNRAAGLSNENSAAH